MTIPPALQQLQPLQKQIYTTVLHNACFPHIDIGLNHAALKQAAQIGFDRWVSSTIKGSENLDGYGQRDSDGGNCGLLGAAAEHVACVVFDVQNPRTIDVPGHMPDIGLNKQVRCRSQDWYDLGVRDRDSNDQEYILITLSKKREAGLVFFRYWGWLYGWEAKQFAKEDVGNYKSPWHLPRKCFLHFDPPEPQQLHGTIIEPRFNFWEICERVQKDTAAGVAFQTALRAIGCPTR